MRYSIVGMMTVCVWLCACDARVADEVGSTESAVTDESACVQGELDPPIEGAAALPPNHEGPRLAEGAPDDLEYAAKRAAFRAEAQKRLKVWSQARRSQGEMQADYDALKKEMLPPQPPPPPDAAPRGGAQ